MQNPTLRECTGRCNSVENIHIHEKEEGRKGGGCLLYYAEYLQATHRRDLFTRNIEAEWLQVKFPSSSVLFSVIYRPPDASGEFFEQIGATLEKAWLKTSNRVLLGDFNCDFQGDSELSANARKLRSIFEMYNMQNVVVENTRETQTTSTLIDLMVTTRRDLISKCGDLWESLITIWSMQQVFYCFTLFLEKLINILYKKCRNQRSNDN